MRKYVFGVDVGGTTVKIGLFDIDGKLLKKWEIPTRTEKDGERILPDIADSIKGMMMSKGIEYDEVLGVGIGTPGPVDCQGTVHGAVNLNWGTFNIPEVLGTLLGLPVKAGNDANVAALGEQWQGGGKGSDNVVMITLGTGVGGGCISNGQMLTGAIGAGGEIGHVHVEDDESEYCGCGCRGCLEQYASATGIVRLAKRKLETSGKTSILRGLSKLTAKEVFDAIKADDMLAVEVAEEFGDYLGKGLAIIAAMVNPEVFVIGGGVSKAGSILFDLIAPAFDKYTFSAIKSTQFRLAMLGNDAGIYGAAGLFLRNQAK